MSFQQAQSGNTPVEKLLEQESHIAESTISTQQLLAWFLQRLSHSEPKPSLRQLHEEILYLLGGALPSHCEDTSTKAPS